MKRIRKVCLLFALPFAAAFFCSGNANAAGLSQVVSKAALEGVWQCYGGGAYKNTFKASKGVNGFIQSTVSKTAVKLPYGQTDAKDNNTDCKQIMIGFNEDNSSNSTLNKGLIPQNVQGASNVGIIKDFFAGNGNDSKGMGYKAEAISSVGSGSSYGKQLTIGFKDNYECRDDTGTIQTCKFGEYTELKFPVIGTSDNNLVVIGNSIGVPSAAGDTVEYIFSKDTSGRYDNSDYKLVITSHRPDLNSVFYDVTLSGPTIPQGQTSGTIEAKKEGYSNTLPDANILKIDINNEVPIENNVGQASDYNIIGQGAWRNRARRAITTLNKKSEVIATINAEGDGVVDENGLLKYDALKLTPQEIYDLYTYYVKDVFKYKVYCENDNPDEYGALPEDNTIKWDKNQQCRIDKNDPAVTSPAENVYGVDDKDHFTVEVDIDDIIKRLNKLDLTNIDTTAPGTSGSSSGTGTEDDEDDCYKAGVESMAWLLCPAINNGAQAIDGIGGQLNKWLNLDVSKIFTGDDNDSPSDTYAAWSVFRNIANIVLSIIFLIIIFSQLTGYGIDNYGIKKALPRLVVIAILINLSYILCEIAVDISNILGVGLMNLLANIGGGISSGPDFTKKGAYQVVKLLFGAMLTAGAVAGVAVGSGGGIMLVISLVLVLIVALVSVLLFFVMLGARMMIVIIFTIISPVAFALYVLPNTKGIFEKWWKIFKSCLIIYPICGALYGASFIIKAIVFPDDSNSNVDFFWMLISICAPYLPFLALPSLLKNAITNLGVAGSALVMLGNGVKKNVQTGTDAAKRSARFKDAQQRALQRQEDNRARRVFNNLYGSTHLTDRQRERLDWAQGVLEARDKRETERRVRTGRGYHRSVINKQRFEIDKAAQDTLLYNDPDYVAGLEEKERLDRDNTLQNTLLYNDLDYVNAQEAKALNSRRGAMGEAHAGVIVVDQATADQRALSTRRDQEIKNHTDRHKTMSNNDIETELRDAVTTYSGARNEENALRLTAAIRTAESRKMYGAMLKNTNNLTGLQLQESGGSAYDSMILNEFSGSGSKNLKEYAKSRAKNSSSAASLDNWASSNSTTDSLTASLDKDRNSLVGVNDDDLEYMTSVQKKIMGGTGADIDTQIALNGALNSTNDKEIAQFNNILANSRAAGGGRGKSGNLELNENELTRIKLSTLRSLDPAVYGNTVTRLKRGGFANQQIIQKLDPEVRSYLHL